jgi:uracil-DNA glycosylase
MLEKWTDLDYFQSGEWQVVEERLNDLTKQKTTWCPGKRNLFAAFKAVPFMDVRVLILGQDPYPNPEYATGLAFSVPGNIAKEKLPPSLGNLLSEYSADLHYPDPGHGDLSPWCKQGVLLWNAIPSCLAWKSASHRWSEWELLTAEVIRKLTKKSIVVCTLGSIAKEYADKYADTEMSKVLSVTHPSPRASITAKVPFNGCRMFSTINTYLRDLGHDPVDWRLP